MKLPLHVYCSCRATMPRLEPMLGCIGGGQLHEGWGGGEGGSSPGGAGAPIAMYRWLEESQGAATQQEASLACLLQLPSHHAKARAHAGLHWGGAILLHNPLTPVLHVAEEIRVCNLYTCVAWTRGQPMGTRPWRHTHRPAKVRMAAKADVCEAG